MTKKSAVLRVKQIVKADRKAKMLEQWLKNCHHF